MKKEKVVMNNQFVNSINIGEFAIFDGKSSEQCNENFEKR